MIAISRKKQKFIIDYLTENHTADVCNADFHGRWFAMFGGKKKSTNWGAEPVYNAMAWLKKLYDQGLLERGVVSLFRPEPGFPNWVYVYTLAQGSCYPN